MGALFYSSWRRPGLTFGIGEVQGSLLERWWLPFWTQSLQRFSFKRASRSHAKTGFFSCLEIAVLLACQLTLAPFSRKLGFSVLLKTRFYLHGSSFFNNSYFLCISHFLRVPWKSQFYLHGSSILERSVPTFSVFFDILRGPEKSICCFTPFS